MRIFKRKKEFAKGIIIPVIANFVESPEVFYGNNFTGIYFQTKDEKFGRITFENLDSIKICRGENLPYYYNLQDSKEYPWIFKIENSIWKNERYNYEKKNYGTSYEFGGKVEEMKTDFSHFVFRFHDQFVEIIARGFWFEEDENSLFKKNLKKGHPFLSLSEINPEKFNAHNLTCQIRRNTKTNEKLVSDAKFCSQKIMEFALELDGDSAKVDNSLTLAYKNEKLISSLKGYFGHKIIEFDGIAKFSDVKPYIENYMEEVYERRKAMGK